MGNELKTLLTQYSVLITSFTLYGYFAGKARRSIFSFILPLSVFRFGGPDPSATLKLYLMPPKGFLRLPKAFGGLSEGFGRLEKGLGS